MFKVPQKNTQREIKMKKTQYELPFWMTDTAYGYQQLATAEDNLNDIVIPGIELGDNMDMYLTDAKIEENKNIEVAFRNIEQRLLKFIDESDAIVGCVAWLTNHNILEKLAEKESVSIIVQKEDFLRPDNISKSELAKLYGNLKNVYSRYEFDVLKRFSYCRDPSIYPVRCVGNHNRDKIPSFPRMHNKFIVSLSYEENGDFGKWKAKSVWTGSFNFSYNAGRSFENAIIIKDEEIASAYLHEYEQIAALSESLNWTDDWVSPDWRLGT